MEIRRTAGGVPPINPAAEVGDKPREAPHAPKQADPAVAATPAPARQVTDQWLVRAKPHRQAPPPLTYTMTQILQGSEGQGNDDQGPKGQGRGGRTRP